MRNKKFISFKWIEILARVLSLALLILLFLKAIINLDTNYDTGWYHHVFAARIWGIIPKDLFLTEKHIEYRYDGFPLLAHFLQGFFWKITGTIKATNLVAYFSVIAYLLFLRSYFKVPWYVSTIAIFTIPVVITHSTASYVDLFGNIGVSIAVMMIYRFSTDTTFPNKKDLLIFGLGMFVGANTKPQLTVIVGVLWIVAFVLVPVRFLFSQNFKVSRKRLVSFASATVIASSLIFYTSIKNVVIYGNPVYPVKVQVAGIVLNHEATPATYSQGNRPQKWLRSVLEINTPKWSVDQYSSSPGILDRAGGFFGAYVAFNLLLLVVLAILEFKRKEKIFDRLDSQAIIALIIVTGSSMFVANFPQSHELRYFMFWMIILVSLNLSIVCSLKIRLFNKSLLTCYLFACIVFFFTMCIKIDYYYWRPVFEPVSVPPRGFTSAEQYVKDENAVKAELIEQIIANERICLLSRAAIPKPTAVPYASIANAIFYSSYFHREEVKDDYAIQAVTNPEGCGDLPIVPNPLTIKTNKP